MIKMSAKTTLDDTADMSLLSESTESETTVVSLAGSFPSETAFLAIVLLETPTDVVDGFFFFGPSFPVQEVTNTTSHRQLLQMQTA